MSQDSEVGIANGYGLGSIGVIVRVSVGSSCFSPHPCSDRFRSHPASHPLGAVGSFYGAKVTSV
jgi:hypothetical protein